MSRKRGRPAAEDADFVVGRDGADLQGPRRFAHILLVVIALFFVAAFAWASQAELEEVTRGEGKVIPSRKVQVVQNLEGGIIAEIRARSGQVVEEGEVVLRINNTIAASEVREARSRYLALQGSLARLQAEVADIAIAFPDEVLEDAPQVARNEQALFEARRQALEAELRVLRNQARQREQELAELRARLGQLERSSALAREELALAEPMAASRVMPRMEILELRRQANDLEGEFETTQLQIPRIESALEEVFERIDERLSNFRAEAQRELNGVLTEVDALRESLTADEDRMLRTEVRAPVRGTVKEVLVTTVGEVVQPGEDLIEIVPLEDTLLVEAQVRPADIAFLRPGLDAVVKVTAYDFGIYGGLEAEVEDISADTITNDEGESFYRIRVRTRDNALERAGEVLPIIPGMTTEVDILTGEKTVLDYLLKPILKAQQRALREP